MKIEKPKKISSVGPLNRTTKVSTPTPPPVSPPRQVEDVVSILGIPPEEMTPRVQAAIEQLIDEINRLRAELANTRKRVGELSSLADEDFLVPASNRRAFLRELTRVISFSERYGAPCSLLYFDLNNLKKVNDDLGHAAGDEALKFFAQSLVVNIRDSDVVGRIGGDEFGVILLNSDEDTAVAKAREIDRYLDANPMHWQDRNVYLSAAHGIVSFRPGIDANTAMAEADHAMYAEKKRLKTTP